MKAPRWVIRTLVVLTALLCLGVAGYAGQVWWARRVAVMPYVWTFVWMHESPMGVRDQGMILIQRWRAIPWYGEIELRGRPYWTPRRACYERLRSDTGRDFGNDPSAWEAWFKAHPNLVWDGKLKRLVDKP